MKEIESFWINIKKTHFKFTKNREEKKNQKLIKTILIFTFPVKANYLQTNINQFKSLLQ